MKLLATVCVVSSYPAEWGTEAASQPDYDGELRPAWAGGHHNSSGQTAAGRMNHFGQVIIIKSFCVCSCRMWKSFEMRGANTTHFSFNNYQTLPIAELNIKKTGLLTLKGERFLKPEPSATLFLSLQFKCCGSNNSQDWMTSVYISLNPEEKMVVPDSCCKTITLNCGKRDHPSNIYKVEVSAPHASGKYQS